MIVLGELSLWIALLLAFWGATVSFAGGYARRPDLIRSGERAADAAFGFTLLASVGLWNALLTRDFSLAYVASQISANVPNVYVFTAFWSGPAGSLLFWALILTFYSALVVRSNRVTNRALMPFVTATLCTVAAFFLGTTAVMADPFQRLDWVPMDGRGMNPQLQNPGMAVHPPMLYLGFVATTVPFAFAVAALVTRQLDREWVASVRRWTCASWLFLTAGILLGMWWAYVELGWGGYWAWDPVENTAVLPWLTSTAFLHSVVLLEKRGMLRRWNVALVMLTFLLTILGICITRSGIVDSVHSFVRSPLGAWFGAFLLTATITAGYLVTTRLQDLESTVALESVVSREAALLSNNLLLVGIAFSVLWGTLFPVLSEWARGTGVTAGPPFFRAMNVPLGLLLLALTGIGPLIAWRKASLAKLRRQFLWPASTGFLVAIALLVAGMRTAHSLIAFLLAGFTVAAIVQEFVNGVAARRSIHGEAFGIAFVRLIGRSRRRYGGYIVHAGIVMLFAAFAGLPFRAEYDVSLTSGQAFEATDPFGRHWRFVSQGVSTSQSVNSEIASVALDVWRDGERVGLITTEKRQYVDSRQHPTFEPSTEVGIHTDARQDTYVVLASLRDEAAELRITFNPLVVWVWLGGALMMLGGVIVTWPRAERGRQPAHAAPVPAAAAGASTVGAA